VTEEGKGWSLTYHLLHLGGVTNVLVYSFVYSFESGTEEVRLTIWVVSGAVDEHECEGTRCATQCM
jgi:hypothetical protein